MTSIGSLSELHSPETYGGTLFCPFEVVGELVYTLFIHGFCSALTWHFGIEAGASRVNIASYYEIIFTTLKGANNLMELCWLRELSKN
jgi:hypothetical protein